MTTFNISEQKANVFFRLWLGHYCYGYFCNCVYVIKTFLTCLAVGEDRAVFLDTLFS